MIDPFSVLIYVSLLIPFSAILYQGVKMVFPRSSRILNLAIASSMSFVAVSLVAHPILALLSGQSFPAFSVPSIMGLILGIPALLVVLIFTGLFIYCGVVYLKYRISTYRVLRGLDRYPYRMNDIDRDIIIPSVRRNRSIRSRRRRPSGLILELDLTEDKT